MSNSRSWVKLSTSILDNDKFLGIEDEHPAACWLWVKAITFCFENDTDGRISELQARKRLSADMEDIQALVDAGLWDTVVGGYAVHDYLDYQQSSVDRAEESSKRKAAGRKGGLAKSKQSDSKPVANAKQDAKQNSSRVEKSRVDKSIYTNTPLTPQGESHVESQVLDIPIDQPPSIEASDDVGEYSQSFENWWAAYPKHEAKRTAYRAYKAARKRTTDMVLLAGAQKYAADPNRDDVYTKNASTWLNGDCWNDKPQARRQPTTRTDRARAEWQQDAEIYRQLKAEEQR